MEAIKAMQNSWQQNMKSKSKKLNQAETRITRGHRQVKHQKKTGSETDKKHRQTNVSLKEKHRLKYTESY